MFHTLRSRWKQLTAALSLSLVMLLSACSLPGLGATSVKDGLIIAGGNTTERQILAEIMTQMIDHYMPEVNTSLINNLGSTMLIIQTLQNGDSNVSGAMYTGTSLTGELGLDSETDPDIAFEQVVRGYDEQFDMVWFPSYGFDNTYAFMVTEAFAAEHGLSKISDLEAIAADLRLGVDTSWISRPGDGYQGFLELYEFDFGDLLPMEIGLVYQAVQSGNMDIVLGYSTDGRISSYNLVLLEDDRHLFPPYDASPAVTKDSLRRWPELETILLKLEGTINSPGMAALNRQSDEDLLEPATVARLFLQENNYFEGKEIVPLAERVDWPVRYGDNWETLEGGQK